jgi:hypothetical protein
VKRLLTALAMGACLAGPLQAAPPAHPTKKPATATKSAKKTAPSKAVSTADLIADLADVNPAVRKAAAQKLKALPRASVATTCVGLVEGKIHPRPNNDRMASAGAVALDVLVRLDPERAGKLAQAQIETRDPFMREAAGTIVAQLDDAVAVPFLARALKEWGTDNAAGMHSVILGLGRDDRAETGVARAAIEALLTQQPLPARNPKFTYESSHDTPQDGDQYRCWLYKADGCLELVSLHPYAEADAGVRRCLLIDELRVAASLALARIAPPDAGQVIRAWLERDQNTEHRLGLYRALFIVGGDNEHDRLACRDTFTATQAPSAAWMLGLRAMIELFDKRADEPALRVVSSWKLRGDAAALRAAALDTMKAAHPEVYAKVLGKGYVPPVLPQ